MAGNVSIVASKSPVSPSVREDKFAFKVPLLVIMPSYASGAPQESSSSEYMDETSDSRSDALELAKDWPYVDWRLSVN